MKRKYGKLAIIACISVMGMLIICLRGMNPMNKEDRFNSLFQYVCEEFPIDWRLAKAVAIIESSLNPMAVSSAGAKGLMQLMDGTAADMRVIQVFDTEENVKGGVRYLQWCRLKFFGLQEKDIRFALASYNGGFLYIQEAQHLTLGKGKDADDWNEVKSMLSHKECIVNGKRPDAKQIIRYVEKVMRQYKKLKEE